MILGHKIIGSGETKLMIMHDWSSDTTGYEQAMQFLDPNVYTVCLVDLRGYGRSKQIKGTYTLEETVTDLWALVDHLGWKQFHVLGHSMSALTAQYAAIQESERVQSLILVTPVLPSGFAIEGEMLQFIENVGRDDDEAARQSIHYMTSHRRSDYFAKLKVKQWRETSTAEARLGYLKMFTQASFADKAKTIQKPVFILLSKYDAEHIQEESLRPEFERIYPKAQYYTFSEAGHFPMTEMPVAFADVIDDFLRKTSKPIPSFVYDEEN